MALYQSTFQIHVDVDLKIGSLSDLVTVYTRTEEVFTIWNELFHVFFHNSIDIFPLKSNFFPAKID